ncbi:hypothetical protein ACA689_001814 [Vibrio vulnificus]|nr:hypothetical protein [Vibrio vulnificus]ELS0759376.1 hypothetical protein [Vibrio vulnificus]ELV8670536.1 hypothetical protein [Vibrio vulnificus]MCU8373853.1 hypothetical protein [Vibrio vulnificus]
MILITKRHSASVMEAYIERVRSAVRKKLYCELKNYQGDENYSERKKLYSFCSFVNLTRQIGLKPKDLSNELLVIEKNYPEVIEFYASSFFYRDALSIFSDGIAIASKNDKLTFDNNIDLLLSSLVEIKLNHNGSCVVDHLIAEVSELQFEKNRLDISSPRGKLKEQLTKVLSLMKGKDNKDFFPRWVASIPVVYDYEGIIVQELAMSIIESIGIEVCPYCNINVIKQDGKKDKLRRKYRPSLDHYLPKSRYPFLALSIYNFIPSCHECNSTRKADYDTYLNEYIYPYILGLCSVGIFEIQGLSDVLLRKIHDKLELDDINLQCNLEGKLEGKEDLFALNYRYMKKNNSREKVFPILQSFLDSNKGEVFKIGVNEYTQCEFIERNGSIDLSRPAIKQEFKKLKIDVINQVYKTNYRV